MPLELPRRDFFKRAAFASAGLAGVAAGMHSSASAAEPIARNGKPKFKFSLAAYSYRGLLSGEKPQLTMEDFIADCAKMGLEGTELTSYYFPETPSGEYLRRLKHACFRLGLDISGTAIRNDFCHPAGEQRDKEIAHVKRWIDYAETMGAPVIRIFSGKARGDQMPEKAHQLAVDGMKECCDYAGRHGVFLALENHGGLTADISDLLRLIKDVKSHWFGVNLDTGNFHACATAEEAYADMAKMAPYALNVQVKTSVTLKGRKKVESDFSRLAKILGDAGYRGYIVLEYEERDDPREACPRFVEKLRGAFA